MLALSSVISGEPGSIVRLLEGVVIGVWGYRIQMAPVNNWTIGHPGHRERNNPRKILMDKGPFVPKAYYCFELCLNISSWPKRSEECSPPGLGTSWWSGLPRDQSEVSTQVTWSPSTNERSSLYRYYEHGWLLVFCFAPADRSNYKYSQVLTWDVYIVCTHIQTEQCTVYSVQHRPWPDSVLAQGLMRFSTKQP